MRVVGTMLIAFVILIAIYARFATPTVNETGIRIAQSDTRARYLVSNVFATDCVFTPRDGTEQPIRTEPQGRAFLRGTTFQPPGQGGNLSCERDTRIVTGRMALAAQVAEHEFLIAFPGVLLVAVAHVVRPRRESKRHRT